jgi:hypothetical protein
MIVFEALRYQTPLTGDKWKLLQGALYRALGRGDVSVRNLGLSFEWAGYSRPEAE